MNQTEYQKKRKQLEAKLSQILSEKKQRNDDIANLQEKVTYYHGMNDSKSKRRFKQYQEELENHLSKLEPMQSKFNQLNSEMNKLFTKFPEPKCSQCQALDSFVYRLVNPDPSAKSRTTDDIVMVFCRSCGHIQAIV